MKSLLISILIVAAVSAASQLPYFTAVNTALKEIVAEPNGGFGFNMWAVVVDRDGMVTLVTHSGEHRGD